MATKKKKSSSKKTSSRKSYPFRVKRTRHGLVRTSDLKPADEALAEYKARQAERK